MFIVVGACVINNNPLDLIIVGGDTPTIFVTMELANKALHQHIDELYDGKEIEDFQFRVVPLVIPKNDYEIHRTGFQNYALWCKDNPINITSSLVVVEHWKKQFNIV